VFEGRVGSFVAPGEHVAVEVDLL
jgi:hypothetical protein